MLAQLQRLIVCGAAASVLLLAAWFWHRGRPDLALLGPLLLGLYGALYAAALGAEFLLMAWAGGSDPIYKATRGQVLRAWWSEVCTGPVVFGWRQPFFSRRWPDLLPVPHDDSPDAPGSAATRPASERGVVLVHGLMCNRGLWNLWLQRLRALRIPHVAVNLEPIFASIDRHVPTIEAAVQKIHRHTGLAPVVVAHSMGGLAVRRWYAQQVDDHRVHHIITIGTPHRGTWLARLGIAACVRQMRIGSDWLESLASQEGAARASRFTCFYSHCDNIVFPTRHATLPGADNRHLPGLAHVHMVNASEPWDALVDQLRPTGRRTDARGPIG